MVVDVLDGLGIDRAHLVGSSHGSYVAVLSAAAHPDRVGRTVHLGCPGFVDGMNLTGFDRLVLHDVKSPTSVLWGGHDPYGDETVARRFVDALGAAELELLPAAGHLCWLDDVDHAATAIRRHLEKEI